MNNENLKKAAFNYAEDKMRDYIHVSAIDGYIAGAKSMVEKACRCYCDDLCDKGRCGMCFHKHDSEQQIKNGFKYNECNELKFIRLTMLGD